jgi:hypothetical protein
MSQGILSSRWLDDVRLTHDSKGFRCVRTGRLNHEEISL